MTEAEWLTGTDPGVMLAFLRGRASDRKLRLFAANCILRALDPGEVSGAIARTVVELFADQLRRATPSDRFEGCSGASGAGLPNEVQLLLRADPLVAAQTAVTRAASGATLRRTGDVVPFDHRAPWDVRTTQLIRRSELWKATLAAEHTEQAALLRDVFGNPFRPVVVDPQWLTSTAFSLAEAISAERAFDRLPILADALEDAGCDHAELLAHLRGDGPHVQGCWALDLVLGRA
jgi:hypothetical protein